MKRFGALLPIAATFIALAFVLGSAGSSRADKGGCPNANSANSGGQGSENSAHGSEKQGDRDCVPDVPGNTPTPVPTAVDATPTATQEPSPNPTPTQEATPTATPEPTPTATSEPTSTATPQATPTATPAGTPTATPVLTADIEVVEFALLAPPTAIADVAFQVTAQATVRNNGPVTPAIADTTFTPALPAGCSATTGAVTVQNTALALGANAFLSRSWMVTCASGQVQLDMGVHSALDAGQLAIDPNLANNSMSASRSIVVN